jgi:hypothetical protein
MQSARIIRPQTVGELLQLIDALAAEIDDPRIAAAARAIRNEPPGRPPLDDDRHLDEVRAVLVRRPSISATAACLHVARAIARHGDNPESIARRLRDKLRQRAA